MLHEEALTAQIIGAAIEVHRRWVQGSWNQLIKPAWPGNYRCEMSHANVKYPCPLSMKAYRSTVATALIL